MTTSEILNVITMVEMILIVIFCRFVILTMPHTIHYCVARSVFHKDNSCLKWLSQNIYYIGYSLLSICLTIIVVIMAIQFSKRDIFYKPVWIVIVSPFTWFSVGLIIVGHYLWIRRKIKENNKIKEQINFNH